MADKKNTASFGSLQPEMDDILHWNDLPTLPLLKAKGRREGGLHPAAQERVLLGGRLAAPAQERGGHGGHVRADCHRAVRLPGPRCWCPMDMTSSTRAQRTYTRSTTTLEDQAG